MNNYIELFSRFLLSSVFLISGISKMNAYSGTQAYMESQSVPGMLLPVVIVFLIIAPIMIIVGWKTRLAAFALAGYTLLTALLFHFDFADPMQSILFMKNIMIAGGLLLLFTHGANKISLDARISSSH